MTEQIVMSEKEQKEALMAQGKSLNLNIHVNTSLANMVEMVNMGLIYKLHQSPDAPINSVLSKDPSVARKEAQRLVRVRVTNMDPTKKDHTGQIFGFSNSVVGTLQKFVPFDVDQGFHIPQVLVNVIRSGKYRVTKHRKGLRGNDIPYSVELPSFSVEILDALSASDLEAIKTRQESLALID